MQEKNYMDIFRTSFATKQTIEKTTWKYTQWPTGDAPQYGYKKGFPSNIYYDPKNLFGVKSFLED